MKNIINGKTYNSETAVQIACISNNFNTNDHNYSEETLYRTANGQFFIIGSGGPNSRFSRTFGNSRSSGELMYLRSDKEALLFLQDNNCFHEIENLFPDSIIEG